MYNKIASLILNSAKSGGLSDVFVAQPDALKENLAGKIFVLAEIGGKKNEGRKIFDFLTAALSDNYYNDEKILFRGKIEGLKIENIFEVAVTKTNQDLADYLIEQKIRINPAATSLTIGVVYENKLHFANFGRNRALLVYRHGEDYEIINVETAATDAPTPSGDDRDSASAKTPKLFSSVVSGEVPAASYFVFTSEALPEYLSGKDLIDIITKLPPMTAAEQIKNVLAKINTYIPFLGIIIKNTAGQAGPENKEEAEEDASAQGSISSLNYTEQKTEQMLAPAGLISFSKIGKSLAQAVKNWRPLPPAPPKKYLTADDHETAAPLNLGTVRSLNMARSDSFLIKEKIFFKRKTGRFWSGLQKIFFFGANLFNVRSWSFSGTRLKAWLQSLSGQNRLLVRALGAVVLILIISISWSSWSHKRQAAIEDFNNRVLTIEDQAVEVEGHLLYNDENGAGKLLLEARASLAALPQKSKEQQAEYARLDALLRGSEEKVQKIVHAEASSVNDLSGLGVNNLVFAAGKIYGGASGLAYELTPNASTSLKIAVSAGALSNPIFDKNGNIDYWSEGKLASINAKSKAVAVLSVDGLDAPAEVKSFKIFNSNLYLLTPGKNQIYRHTRSGAAFGAPSDWLTEAADLSQATDLSIDGNIYVLENNGHVRKFYQGKEQDYPSAAITPVMTSASKLIVGTNYIYVWEAASKRLAVLAKQDGHLMNQYQLDKLEDLKDFTVDEGGKAAYLLAGEKIYKVGLNQ